MATIDEMLIRAYALENAILHDGKARADAVLAKLFRHGLEKSEIADVMPKVVEIVNEINELSLEKQKEAFEGLKVLIPEKQRERRLELPNVKGEVVLRLAPFPSGPLHIGNARAAVINDYFARKYGGKLLLFIDDTIGSEEKVIVKEAYELIQSGLKWLGIKFEEPIIYKSDRLETYYKYGEKLIELGQAYVCFCDAETLRKNREKGIECEHRAFSVEKNLAEWKAMLEGKYKEGEAVLRLKTSMKHPNPAFRDRVLFRLSSKLHPRLDAGLDAGLEGVERRAEVGEGSEEAKDKEGKEAGEAGAAFAERKARVWPMMEMTWAVDDYLFGITHIIRGKELMIETEMEKFIFNIFRWPLPEFIHTGLLRIRGLKLSKSKSQKEIKSGVYFGWDDPRTWSLQSLARRGINPEAVKEFCLSFGLQQSEVTVPIELLYSFNKKYVESSPRFFFIPNPVEIEIHNAPNLKAVMPLHPSKPELGKRILWTDKSFYISLDDYQEIRKAKDGTIFRFMYLFNFYKKAEALHFHSLEHKKELNAKMIHWLPTVGNLNARVLMPSGEWVGGLLEKNARLKPNDIVQFERFGFVRLDAIKKIKKQKESEIELEEERQKKERIYEFWFCQP
ncbi:MAG: glutamate--tRNA ligase family protein [Candidatus Pacearchaeota archaeon]